MKFFNYFLTYNKFFLAAVAASWEKQTLILDSIDHDGSTLIKSKIVDYKNKVSNDELPNILCDTIKLSDIIFYASNFKNLEIVLKLDVEGSEYEILDDLFYTDAIKHITKFFCEFHYERIGLDNSVHDNIVKKLNDIQLNPIHWDASSYMIINFKGRLFIRYFIIRYLNIFKIAMNRLIK
jgi:hypothetical protein